MILCEVCVCARGAFVSDSFPHPPPPFQQLLSLPVELSSSGVVLGFFSTWQDDTAFPAEYVRAGRWRGEGGG